jgi:flavin reductase (DIM6/NTAB) family NADH-FMN oxidoreductase RutF
MHLHIDPKEIPFQKVHAYLLGAVVPRPIALASTVDVAGNVNLSPFSFFNVFSANPPVLVFSPARRGRDSTTKHTYDNVNEVAEVVINIVSYNMVEQVSLASCEFPKGVNEFVKAGLTQVPSMKVKPPRVGESPVSMECKVNQVIGLGTGGAAGNLVICEVLMMHVEEEILDKDGRIDPQKIDAVARMGQDYYCRASGESVFIVPKPNDKVGVGIDQLPGWIRTSSKLTGNELARLANVDKIPEVHASTNMNPDQKFAEAKVLLSKGLVNEAWKILLQ